MRGQPSFSGCVKDRTIFPLGPHAGSSLEFVCPLEYLLVGQLGKRLAITEDRRLLNADPIANPDSFYFTSENTGITVGSGDTKVVDNDWDPEASSLTASVVDQPANGTLTNFSSTAGTFTYTPDNAFTGIDTFTLQSERWDRRQQRGQPGLKG